jgi:hypothetical protein
MSIFWVPDEDDQPRGLSWPPRTVADEVAQWVDERALQRAAAVIHGFRIRIVTTARGLTRRRLARRLGLPAIRHRRVT